MRASLLRPFGPVLLLAVFGLAACDDGGGGMDAGVDSGTPDSGPDQDAGCTEFTPELCPRDYPEDPIPIDLICEAFSDAFCRANGRCCMRDGEVYESFDACLTDQLSRCGDLMTGYEYVDAVRMRRINYNSSATGLALDRLGPLADACEPVFFGDVILEAMEGTLRSGEACEVDTECEDPETGTGYTCRLDELGVDMVCRGDRFPGDDCMDDADCAAQGGYCDTTCRAQLALGETCARDEQCESRMCIDGACVELTGENAYCVVIGERGRAFEH